MGVYYTANPSNQIPNRRDFDEEYEAWNWLEQEGWGLVAIEPPDPIKPGVCKYYFKRQRLPGPEARASRTTGSLRSVARTEQRRGQPT